MKPSVLLLIIVSALVLAGSPARGDEPGCVPQPCPQDMQNMQDINRAASICGTASSDFGAGARRAVVDSLAGAIRRSYVYPARAEGVIAEVESRLENGRYDEAATAAAFGRALTADLHEITSDLHFMVSLVPLDREGESPACPSVCDPDQKRPAGVCVRKARRLPGNVGYLEMSVFENPRVGLPAVQEAMAELEGASAYVVDLRESPGGHHDMITALAGYFLAPGTEIHTLYRGAQGTSRRVVTQRPAPGAEPIEAPLYILTGPRTASSAEAFAYDLKHLGRATIVGETTAGTGHCAEQLRFEISGHALKVRVPVHEVIHPVTKTNWEGTGVVPHAAVPAADALSEALRLVEGSS